MSNLQATIDSLAGLLMATGSRAVASGQSTVYELSRLRDFDGQNWLSAIVLATVVVLFAFVLVVYRRDSMELRPALRVALATLRCIALAGIGLFFLRPERRIDSQLIEESRVEVLADTSFSMGIKDSQDSGLPPHQSRLEQVIEALNGGILHGITERHNVTISQFAEKVQQVAVLPIRDADSDASLRDQPSPTAGTANDAQPTKPSLANQFRWHENLQPTGRQTRLGDAVAQIIGSAGETPLAAVVVVTHGGQNAGVDPLTVAAEAKRRNVPIHVIGVGSPATPRSVRLVDVAAPARAFRGDPMTLTALLSVHGVDAIPVELQVYRRDTNAAGSLGPLVASQSATVNNQPGIQAVRLQVVEQQPALVTYVIRVQPADKSIRVVDDLREVTSEVIDRQLRVLLLAGGPSRDYQFVRNQLRRDPSMVVDIHLQSALPGVSQDAHQILPSFPATKETLFAYDCLIAFDPDWLRLDAAQIGLLQAWVADEAGGLILVAGPVHGGGWQSSGAHAPLQALYPVIYPRTTSLLGTARSGSPSPWPLELTAEGEEVAFLRLTDDPAESRSLWRRFPGMYAHEELRGVKPAATVYAQFSIPGTVSGNQFTPYLVGQFYGAGRVVYMASGEAWRLRSLGEEYFEVYYTKLIRHVTEGRILRGSDRGMILLDQDRIPLGESVVIRARLSDERHEPLMSPSVNAQVLFPDRSVRSVELQAMEQAGMYQGHFRAVDTGSYQISLTLPDNRTTAIVRRFDAVLPDLERERPERDDRLLASLAELSGGTYYRSPAEAIQGFAANRPLAEVIESRREVRLLRGTPDSQFDRQVRLWILGIVCGALSLEWLTRRLSKLA